MQPSTTSPPPQPQQVQFMTNQQRLASGLPPTQQDPNTGQQQHQQRMNLPPSTSSSSASSSGSSRNGSPAMPYGSILNGKDSTSPGSWGRSMHGGHLLPSHLQNYSPGSGMGSSPGVGVRRLAEQFLNSIADDSPAVRPRRIGLGRHTTVVAPSVHVPTQPAELDKFSSSDKSRSMMNRGEEAASSSADESDRKIGGHSELLTSPATKSERKSPETNLSPPPPQSSPTRATVAVQSQPSLLLPNTPSVARAEDDFTQLHADILSFSNSCAEDTQSQKRLRDELVQRTQWSIRCVWPTAQVDLVGSVAAGVCLPKSDLDFVVYFPPSNTPPPSYSYATTPNSTGQGTVTNYTYTTADVAPVVESSDGSAPQASLEPVQHFCHASTLIKLIGGRKKSKLLFRSTKIQVFKDINLIRLRDGCSGISMDLWFPVDPAMLTRSQQHTMLIQKMLADFPNSFYPLAIVLKSFMSQNLLNSGYSGLGSYGVLLMLIRFLQYERFHATKEKRPEESNLGKLLVGFFRLYATFDYIHHAIDVVNLGPDGDFIAKPPVLIVKRVKRQPSAAGATGGPSSGKKPRKKRVGDDSDEDEEDHEGHHDGDADEEDEPVEEERESQSLKKKRTNAADRFTLLILDPMDSQNQIICHHKALRNMIGAFIRAIMILDPDSPAPPLMLPPIPVVVDTPALAAGPGAVAGTPTNEGSQPSSAPNTPPLIPQPIQNLPPFPGLTATANNTDTTRFHRLIEVGIARLGPQTKPCPSAQCMNLDGSSKTMCPIQNKVCFTCGHLFMKTIGGGLDAARPTSSGSHTSSTSGGRSSKIHQGPPTPSSSHINGVNGASNTPRHHHHGSGQLQQQHRSPTLQHRNMGGGYNSRAPMAGMPTQQQQIFNAQAMIAAQQLLAAQISSQNAAAAAAAGSGTPSPIMFYNLNTNQVEPYGQQGASQSFIPVMAYSPAYTPTAVPTNDAQIQAAQAQQLATMQAIMQQMQITSTQQQQQAAVQQQYPTFIPQANAAVYPSMYAQTANNSNPDLSAYMNSGYVPALSYDYSPTYATRSLSDPNIGVMSPPPSPPINTRSMTSGGRMGHGGGGKGNSSRANQNFNHNLMVQQQQQQQQQLQQQQYYSNNGQQQQPYVYQ